MNKHVNPTMSGLMNDNEFSVFEIVIDEENSTQIENNQTTTTSRQVKVSANTRYSIKKYM